MSNALNIILTIVILIVMLGILISAHEAGHFLFAKIFGVYCSEFSIGFGPNIFSHRKKGGETAFSLRAIPLGGYVSMYSADEQQKEAKKNGEEYVAQEEIGPNQMLDANGNPIPLERSFEAKSLWKRIVIMLAGVTVNFLLSFLFCLIYGLAFNQYRTGYAIGTGITFTETSTGIVSNDYGSVELFASGSNNYVVGFLASYDESLNWPDGYFCAVALAENKSSSVAGYVIDNAAVLTSCGQSQSVTALYYPQYQQKPNDLMSCLTFYSNTDVLIENSDMNYFGISKMPNMEAGSISLIDGDQISFKAKNIETGEDGKSVIVGHEVSSTYTNGSWDFNKVTLTPEKVNTTFGERLKFGCEQWVNFFPTIGNALKQLFKLDFSSIGGVVAMGASISTLTNYMGVGRTFFLYGGLISLNLAILNLFPFPGLDGWQIIVAIVEKIAKKRMPPKVKQGFQIAGFVILMAFAVFIMVKDIIRLV